MQLSTAMAEKTLVLDVKTWPIFSLLTEEFIRSISLACVFGNGNEAIFVTKNDEVFSMGTNCSNCLGFGDALSSLEPRIVESLCKKEIVDFSCGSGPHVIAITANGELYGFGQNNYGQAGVGSTNPCLIPSLITSSISGNRIVKIACGNHHSLALTSEGEIYAFGYNNTGQVGSGTTGNQPTPRKITSSLTGKRVTNIACGMTTSLALIEGGELFAWGYNGNGQLGTGNNVNQPHPTKVTSLNGVVVSEVVCGYAHTMALSDEGSLYAWGANSYGQLGTGNKANLVTATKIAADKRFVEIAATHYNHVSAAMTQTGEVFMWGQCRGQAITTPTLTRFIHVHSVFACFGSPAVTWKPLRFDHGNVYKTVLSSLKDAFNKEDTSDLRFVIDGKTVYVHKSILKIRCDHFRSMFQSHWDEDEKDSIEITQFSFAVYKAFLEYLYTGTVDLPPEDAIGLLDLANAYCEIHLKELCEKIIQQGINVENVAMLMAAAIKYQAKGLEDFCFTFALNHLTAVTLTDAFQHLDDSILKQFITKAAQSGAFKH